MKLWIIGGTVAAAGLGAYLRWAVHPTLTGYRCGVAIGKMQGAKAAGK